MELEEMEMTVDVNNSSTSHSASQAEENPNPLNSNNRLSIGELGRNRVKLEAELLRLRDLPSASSYRIHREKVVLKCLELIDLVLNRHEPSIDSKSMNEISKNDMSAANDVIGMENELAGLLGSLAI